MSDDPNEMFCNVCNQRMDVQEDVLVHAWFHETCDLSTRLAAAEKVVEAARVLNAVTQQSLRNGGELTENDLAEPSGSLWLALAAYDATVKETT